MTSRDDDFEHFVRDRSTALLRSAVLLVGDRGHAEDLLQEVLSRTARHWHRIEGPPESYVRRALLNAAVNGWRRRRPAEAPLAAAESGSRHGPAPYGAVLRDATALYDLRDELLRALRTLPARQRAVLVCRYFDDLSEADTAALLGCSVGTVKSSASRGLSRLREHVRGPPAAGRPPPGPPAGTGPSAGRAAAGQPAASRPAASQPRASQPRARQRST